MVSRCSLVSTGPSKTTLPSGSVALKRLFPSVELNSKVPSSSEVTTFALAEPVTEDQLEEAPRRRASRKRSSTLGAPKPKSSSRSRFRLGTPPSRRAWSRSSWLNLPLPSRSYS